MYLFTYFKSIEFGLGQKSAKSLLGSKIDFDFSSITDRKHIHRFHVAHELVNYSNVEFDILYSVKQAWKT